MENISLALELMVVGMITVFIILMIVIQLGKWLIMGVNRITPEQTVTHKRQTPTPAVPAADVRTQAIIRAAVDRITGGRGQVKNIERLP